MIISNYQNANRKIGIVMKKKYLMLGEDMLKNWTTWWVLGGSVFELPVKILLTSVRVKSDTNSCNISIEQYISKNLLDMLKQILILCLKSLLYFFLSFLQVNSFKSSLKCVRNYLKKYKASLCDYAHFVHKAGMYTNEKVFQEAAFAHTIIPKQEYRNWTKKES